MGLGIGHGLNDPDAWRRKLAEKKAASEPDPNQEKAWEEAWAEAVIDRIRKEIPTAGSNQVEVGEFRGNHLIGDQGEFYPTREQLRGGAALVWDFCQREGLRLFVGGDFKMSGRWNPPFEIIVRLEK